MVFAVRHQPYKGFYLVYSVLSLLFVRLPCWSLVSLLPSLRPRPSWSFKKCISVNLVRYVSYISTKVGKIREIPTHRALQAGGKVKGLWIDPVPELILGDVKTWADEAGVKPVRIPGYWQDKKGENFSIGQKPNLSEKIAYMLHGGGYMSLSAHPTDPTANIARGMLKYCSDIKRTFSIEYRLSSGKPLKEENPFPAALIDALAGYEYLVNVVGFRPSQIVVVGDSAGGNLALALTRYLATMHLPSLAVPSGVVLLSPWCALGTGVGLDLNTSMFTCAKSDYILTPKDPRSLTYAARAFLGPHGPAAAESNVWISPASRHIQYKRFHGFPKTFIVSGDAEVLLDQIRRLADVMQGELGTDRVVYHESKDAVHDYLLFPWHEPHRGETLRQIAEWVSTL